MDSSRRLLIGAIRIGLLLAMLAGFGLKVDHFFSGQNVYAMLQSFAFLGIEVHAAFGDGLREDGLGWDHNERPGARKPEDGTHDYGFARSCG